MDIGILIPIYKPCIYRLENLSFILSYFKKNRIENVYVAEQYTDSEDVRNVLRPFKSVKYINIDIKKNNFNKSVLINRSFSYMNHKYLWIYDADVHIDVPFVLKNIPTNIEIIKPFEKLVMLNETESKTLKNTNKIILSDREYESYNRFGKFSIILDQHILEKTNGYDESYEGWGFQDLDFIERIPKNTKKGYTTNIAFHLWHPRPEKKFYNDNKLKYRSKFTKLKKVKKVKKNNFLDSR